MPGREYAIEHHFHHWGGEFQQAYRIGDCRTVFANPVGDLLLAEISAAPIIADGRARLALLTAHLGEALCAAVAAVGQTLCDEVLGPFGPMYVLSGCSCGAY